MSGFWTMERVLESHGLCECVGTVRSPNRPLETSRSCEKRNARRYRGRGGAGASEQVLEIRRERVAVALRQLRQAAVTQPGRVRFQSDWAFFGDARHTGRFVPPPGTRQRPLCRAQARGPGVKPGLLVTRPSTLTLGKRERASVDLSPNGTRRREREKREREREMLLVLERSIICEKEAIYACDKIRKKTNALRTTRTRRRCPRASASNHSIDLEFRWCFESG